MDPTSKLLMGWQIPSRRGTRDLLLAMGLSCRPSGHKMHRRKGRSRSASRARRERWTVAKRITSGDDHAEEVSPYQRLLFTPWEMTVWCMMRMLVALGAPELYVLDIYLPVKLFHRTSQ